MIESRLKPREERALMSAISKLTGHRRWRSMHVNELHDDEKAALEKFRDTAVVHGVDIPMRG